jgi:multidrug efflux pump subunit AcrA (membrane-fusion protein)
LLAVALAMFIPVRLSALAPAEVIALNAMAIASPQDGVISAFHVQPNSAVKTGDRLFSLDDSALASRREVARRGVSIARADSLVAQQRAFDDLKSKGELASALGRVREKEAELSLVESSLGRVVVKAERDGIAVFGDPNDWLGRPVQTGERVMQLADPRDTGVLVWLPVSDALNLEAGAPIRLFLHTTPLNPLSAKLLQTSYQAVLSPEGVSAYRLRGTFDDSGEKARIGLRGTARVSGDWATLGYYLFRRPIAAVREWTGL